MADPYYDPASGVQLTQPDAPGDFSETVTRKEPIAFDENGNPLTADSAAPFTPLTPGQALDERARLNMKAANRGTIVGSSLVAKARAETQLPTPGPDVPQETIDAAGGFPFVHEGKTYVPEEEKKASQDYLENVQADILAYNSMRPYKGFTEGAYSLAGQALGAAGSPENLILPELKIGTAAWYAKNPVMGSILAQGFGQAAIQGGADVLTQTNEVRAALKKDYSLAETMIAIPVGGIFGAGVPAAYHVGSRLFKDAVEGIGNRLRGEGPGLVPEVRPAVPAEPPTIKPEEGFDQGGSVQAIVGKDSVPTGETRPEPMVNQGNVRLYHTDKPGEGEKDTASFSLKPEEGTTSYIDLPETVVEPLRNGEDVSLPKSLSEQRQPLPVISQPESIAERVAASRAAEARAGEKITAEPEPETGKSFTEFVREQGGLKPSPEVDAIYGKKRPDLIRKGGKTLDQMREAAVEAKYFRDEGIEAGGTASTTPDDVLRRLADEDKGIKHYAEGKGPPRAADMRMAEIESEVYAHMQESGHEPTAKENRGVFRQTANMVYRDGLSVENAFERALMHEGERQRGAKFMPEEVPFETRQKGLVGTSAAPAPGTHRPAGGVAGAPDAPGAAQAANLNGVMHGIARDLDIEIRAGVHKQGAVGTLKGNLMRLIEQGPDGYITFAHEISHALEQRVGQPIRGLISRFAHSMENFAGPAAKGDPGQIAREGFGEFLALYMSERDVAKFKDPNLTREFRDVMEQHAPQLLEQIDRGYNAYQAYQAAPSARVVTSMITTDYGISAVAERDPLKRNAVRRWLDNMYKVVVNKQDPLNETVKYILRDWSKRNKGQLYDLPPDKDPRSVYQVLRNGSHSMTLQEMHGGLLDPAFNHQGVGIVSTMERVTAHPVTGVPAPDLATVATRKRDFSAFLAARFHQDLRAAMKQGKIELRKPPTGMTDGDAAMTVAAMEKAYPQFPVQAEEVYAYRRGLLKKRLDTGLISMDDFQALSQPHFDRYVPLMRDMSSLTEGGRGGGGVGGGGRGHGLEDLGDRARTGSTRDIKDVIDSLMQQHFKINEQANYNKAWQTYRDFVRNVGGAEAGKFAEEVPNHEMRVQDIDVRRVIEQSLQDQGYNIHDARDIAQFHLMELNVAERVKLFHAQDIKGAGKPILFGMDGGERAAIRLPDNEFGRDLFNALDFLGPMGTQSVGQAAGLLHSVLVKPARLLRTGAVTTFTFAIKNMIRDGVGSFMYINGVRVPLEAAVRGAWQMAMEKFGGGSDIIRRYRAMGGLEGGGASAAFSREARTDIARQALHGGWRIDVAAEERRLARAAKGIEATGGQLAMEAWADARKMGTEILRNGTKAAEFGETANRIGIFDIVYKENKKMGRTDEFAMIDAAQKARDFTDFGRHGSGTELITQTIPFLGASIQGTDKFLREIGKLTNLTRPLTQFEQAAINDYRKQAAWKLSSLAAFSLALEYLYQDDAWYQNLPLQTRATSWNLKVMGVPVRIPKPFEWATLLNLAENVFRYSNTGDSDHMASWLKSLAYTHNLPANFPIVSTALGLASNYDSYFDRPIVPERQQHLFPHLQRLNDTSQLYISIAAMLDRNVWNSQDAHKKLQFLPVVGGLLASAWSPIEASWMVSRMLGDWPRELGGIDGMAKSLTTGDNLKMNDIPVLRSIIQEKMIMGEPIREIINQTNQHDGRLTRALASYNYYVQAGDELGRQHLFDQLDNPQKEYVRLHLIDAGKIVNTMHPMERGKAIYTAVATILNQMNSEAGIRSMVDPTKQVPLADNMKLPVANLLTEFAANQARNTLIAQGIPGYKGQTMTPTQPDLDKLKAMAPEVHKELVSQLAEARVLPWESVQKYWPEVQRLITAGGDRKTLSGIVKTIGFQAAAEHGLEGGGIALRTKALVEGDIVKRGNRKPGEVPATQGALP